MESLLPSVIVEPARQHRTSIIWLHGLGADGHDFEPMASELDLPDEWGVRFILPHAPRQPITINGGYVMRAWYDIASSAIERTPDVEGILTSRQAVEQLIREEREQGIPPERIILAGFSQGGVIAIETATRNQTQVGGAIALSCYAATPERIPAATGALPFFMGHGLQDTIVPLTLGSAARSRLEDQGYKVEWRDYAMPHSVCAQEIDDIRNWLIERIDL